MAARRFILATLLLLFGQCIASAHNSLESTLGFWVRTTGIDVRIFMSRDAASILLQKGGEQVSIVRDNFPEFEDRLAANGRSLLTLTAGDGTTLKADASAASITDEDDICYDLHYPLPKALPASLTIRGNYFDRMEVGHVGSIYMSNATGDQIGQGEISAESPDFEVHLPAVSASLVQPHSAADSPASRSSNESSHYIRWGLWAMLGGCVVVIAIAALRSIARQNVVRKTGSRTRFPRG
jgi:hypothetical protein